MAVYEYRCTTCDVRFESRRPMAEADAPATCPAGHTDARRLLSVFASVAATGGGGTPAAAPGGGGGCCGGACGC